MAKRTRAETVHGKPGAELQGNAGAIFEPLGVSWLAVVTGNHPNAYLYQKICVFLLAFLVFANGITNGFNYDDSYYTTEQNRFVNRGWGVIPEIFSQRSFVDNNNNYFDYRPMTQLSFVLQHQLVGGGATMGHFINVLLYAVICLLIFGMLREWLGSDKKWQAFFVVLLYAVHPLHTEVVNNIKCRDELLATIFGLLTWRAMWKWTKTKDRKQVIYAALLIAVGILCKQSAVMYPLLLPAVLYFFTDMPLRKIVVPIAIVFFSCILFVAITEQMLPDQHRIYMFFENPLYTDKAIPLSVKAATASVVLGWYAVLHVVPYPLSFYYGYSYVPLFYWTLQPLLAVAGYLALGWFIVKTIRKRSVAAFGAIYFVASLVPFSNLLSPAPGMMAERFAFSASLGYCILVVSLLAYLFKPMAGSRTAIYFIVSFLLVFFTYSGMSMVRNTQWKSSWTLFSHDIKHLQKSVKANMFYAEQVMFRMDSIRKKIADSKGADQQKYKDSLASLQKEEKEAYLRALAVSPYHYEALVNLGVSYINMDSFDMAVRYLREAKAYAPGSARPVNFLGVAFARLADRNPVYLDSAVIEFEAAIRVDSTMISAYSGLALACLEGKDTARAIKVSQDAVRKNAGTSLVYMQLAQLYLYRKDTLEAIRSYERGAEVARPDRQLLQILQSYYHERDAGREAYYRQKERAAF